MKATTSFCVILSILLASLLFGTPDAFAKKGYGKKSSANVSTARQEAKRDNLKWDTDFKEKNFPQILKNLEAQGIKVDEPSQQDMVKKLNTIMNRLKAKALIPEVPFEVHLVSHETVNAVCYPGGGILFFTGIFDKNDGLIDPKNDDEIAAVMGHEMAHATLRHAYRKQKTAKTVGFIGGAISAGVGASAGGGWQSLFETVFDVSTGLYFPSYSREHESEADLEGVYTLKAANYKPEAAVALWERAAAKSGGKEKSSVFASHPANGKRANDLRAHIETMETGN